jgi:hypothetical protein
MLTYAGVCRRMLLAVRHPAPRQRLKQKRKIISVGTEEGRGGAFDAGV